MKREHGAVPFGNSDRTNAATAPATVSGEQCRITTGQTAGKVGKAETRKSGDLPSEPKPNSGGVPGQCPTADCRLSCLPPPSVARRAQNDVEDELAPVHGNDVPAYGEGLSSLGANGL